MAVRVGKKKQVVLERTTNAGEEGEARELTFQASFALRIRVPENYVAIINTAPMQQASHTYRISYKLFPTEELTNIDVALFGLTAKVYCNDQVLCLKVHEERTHMWVAWSKIHVLKIRDDNALLSIFEHVCKVVVGEAAEKVQYDRPKGFQVTDAFYQSVQFLSRFSKWSSQTDSSSSDLPERSEVSDLEKWDKLSQISLKSVDIAAVPPWEEVKEIQHSLPPTSPGSSCMVFSDGSSHNSNGSASRRVALCSLQPVTKINHNLLCDWIILKNASPSSSDFFQMMDDIQSKSASRRGLGGVKMLGKMTPSAVGQRKKLWVPELVSGSPILSVRMSAFFTGIAAQAVKMEPSPRGPLSIVDAIFLISTEDKFLSPAQRIRFNPLTVGLRHVEDLPENSNADADEPCVFLRYKIFNQKLRKTRVHPHDTEKVLLNDTYVYLLGTVDPVKLCEYFCGPPLIVEVHDRDAGETKKNVRCARPSIYGSDSLDHRISSTALQSHRFGCEDLVDLDKSLSPFGEAQLNLCDFLKGCTQLDFCEQVMRSAAQRSYQSASQKYFKEQFPCEDIYLEAGTSLEARITLSVPLYNPVLDKRRELDAVPPVCFTRMVIRFSTSQRRFLCKLLTLLFDLNRAELAKHRLPSTYCLGLDFSLLPISDRVKYTIDIITGFHVFDNNFHVFYLEGLAVGSMKLLLERLPSSENSCSPVKILYNSAMIFSERLYLLLPTFVCHLRLLLSIKKLLVSVRKCKFESSRMQDECMRGLQKIQQLVNCKSLEDVTKNKLFPTKNMILSITQNVGTTITVDQTTGLLLTPKFLEQSK